MSIPPQMMIKMTAAYMMAIAVIWSAGVWSLDLLAPLGVQTWTLRLGSPMFVLAGASFFSYLLVTYHSSGLLFAKIWVFCNACLAGYLLLMMRNGFMVGGGCLAVFLLTIWFLKELVRRDMKKAYTTVSALHKHMWQTLSEKK